MLCVRTLQLLLSLFHHSSHLFFERKTFVSWIDCGIFCLWKYSLSDALVSVLDFGIVLLSVYGPL
jgi:hypothetical protein